jgi:CRP-like cAMP-binding protein
MATIKTSTVFHINFFRSLPIFVGFTDENINYYLENARIKRYDKGKVLFLQGDVVTMLYIVRSGWIKLFRNTEDGTEAVITLCKEGDLFSKAAMLENAVHPACGQVVEEAIIYEIPSPIIRESVKKDHKLALNVISYLSNNINLLGKQVEHLSIMTTDKRVACFLLHLCTNETTNSTVIKLPCSKELLANYLGMKPETFSRALLKLKKASVRVESDHIAIDDLYALRKYTCISCSSAGNCIACPKEKFSPISTYSPSKFAQKQQTTSS